MIEDAKNDVEPLHVLTNTLENPEKTDTYSQPCQISKVEQFAKIVNSFYQKDSS